MDIINIIQTLKSLNWLELLGAVNTILAVLIVVFSLVPGDQPEKTLRAVVNFIARFSRK